MPKLTAAQKTKIERALNDRYQILIEEVRDELERSGEQHYVDLAGRVGDVGDDSVADMLTDLSAAIVDRQVREIREIEAARKRLRQESFGVCSDCGGDIGFERLMAYPTAKRCFPCQQQHEKTYAGESTPTL